jgi:sugar phosphate isomerase/epimerase
MNTRRAFLKTAGAGLLAAAAPAVPLMAAPAEKTKAPSPFKVSIAGFSFARFNIDDTLKMMKRMDVHYLCIKDFHLPLDSDAEQIKAFKEKLAAAGVTGYGVGPIYMKNEAEADRAFDYAKRVGVNLIVGVPDYALLPYVDKKVKEFNFNYAIHIHGPDIDRFPDAKDVIDHVKDLDPRIGMCLDIGHDARAGRDPIADMKQYHARVFDIHIKNVTAPNKSGSTCEMGRGVIDIPAFVRTLRKVKYTGATSLEFEKDMSDPLAGLAESIGYLHGVIDATA